MNESSFFLRQKVDDEKDFRAASTRYIFLVITDNACRDTPIHFFFSQLTLHQYPHHFSFAVINKMMLRFLRSKIEQHERNDNCVKLYISPHGDT